MTRIVFFFFFVLVNLCSMECFEEISLELSIKEEERNGSLVYDLKSLLGNHSRESLIKFVNPCSYLYVDHWQIRSLRIDREEICLYQMNCSFQCHLLIENEAMKLIHFKVNIEDRNDHRPRFVKKFYFYHVDSNMLVNSSIQLEQAEDKDYFHEHNFYSMKLINSTTTTTTTTTNNDTFPFQLNFDSQNHFLLLTLVDKLDNEKQIYFLHLFVHDELNNEDHCFIEIEISSILFLPPEFQSKLYHFVISDVDHFSLIGQVKATSTLFPNANDPICYRLIFNEDFDHPFFQINSTTGQIFFLPSNQQQKQFYRFFVEAFFLNNPSLSSLTTVQISSQFTSPSAMDHKSFEEQPNALQIFLPKIFRSNSSNENQISLLENSSVPLTILQLSSSSPHLNISQQNYFQLNQLDHQFFELVLVQSFDYETIHNFTLDLLLLDHLHSIIQIKSFLILIQNINDCSPTFDQDVFHFSIQENHPTPFLLHTFQAHDQDQLDQLTYSLQSQDQNIFSVHSTNGQLWISQSLDREIQSNYSFSICVFDQLHQTCSQILLQILDENDHTCQFNSSSSSLQLTIDENLPSNTHLTQIQALDLDSNENATLFYQFNTPTPYLTINSTTAIIRTTSNTFDAELFHNYSITIQACDNIHSFPSLCCSVQLTIHLRDLDDNSPFLIYPSATDQVFLIDYINQTMPQLKASDLDIQPNHRLITFTILDGSLSSFISIDYYSGQLFLQATSALPLYGTLLISLSAQTTVQLTLLIYDNHTDPTLFLRSLQSSSSSSSSSSLLSFQFFPFVYIGIFLFLCSTSFLLFYFIKHQYRHHRHSLITTPSSTTTLSTRSIPTSNNHKQTYYSFGHSVSPPDVCHL